MQWKLLENYADYNATLAAMEQAVADIIDGKAEEQIWLLEHPPLFTAGTSAESHDIVATPPYPVHHTGRGGQYTYHGPGQRVAYMMLDLHTRGQDVRAFVQQLEACIIQALASYNVEGFTREGRTGVWVHDTQGKEAKIAAIGIRLRKWVSFHGISVNIHPNLNDYQYITPCGISNYGVTSLEALGISTTLEAWDDAFKQAVEKVFGA